ncbi:SRPBCC family protein [Brevundimonas sp. R86498]|uniref:SRPBCC family protein n=1 Tax=Brevundimonas sp. R86498 TaxID=3093845 RepID=UPI0037C9C375
MVQDTDANPCHTPGEPAGFDLELRRHFDAPPEKIWQAWITPDLLKQWFCPKPWRVSEATIDPRPGGVFNTVMNGPDGEVMPGTGVFLEVVPGRKWITTDAFAPGWKPTGLPFMVTEVTLTPTGDGGTDYVAIARHWNADTMKQHEEMGFHQGWGAAADQLAELLRTL